MNAAAIFISHTTADDAMVAEIRKALEGQGLIVIHCGDMIHGIGCPLEKEPDEPAH